MADSLIEAAAQISNPTDRRIFGVALAQVVNDIDATGQGRVQVRLPWMPGFEPWARVAAPMAGDGRGVFFIPHSGDEVVVAFNQGDVREPFVIGSLWSLTDKPPRESPTDAAAKRVIHTRAGHDVELDDVAQTIKIKSSTEQKVEITPKHIELSTTGDAASIRLDTEGTVTIKGMEIVLDGASSVKLKGLAVDVTADLMATFDGGAFFGIKGTSVAIN